MLIPHRSRTLRMSPPLRPPPLLLSHFLVPLGSRSAPSLWRSPKSRPLVLTKPLMLMHSNKAQHEAYQKCILVFYYCTTVRGELSDIPVRSAGPYVMIHCNYAHSKLFSIVTHPHSLLRLPIPILHPQETILRIFIQYDVKLACSGLSPWTLDLHVIKLQLRPDST
jgi:hypothetical protein